MIRVSEAIVSLIAPPPGSLESVNRRRAGMRGRPTCGSGASAARHVIRLAVLGAALLSGCTALQAARDPLAEAPPSPSAPWTPPPEVADSPRGDPAAPDYARAPGIPHDVAVPVAGLGIPELIDIALRNSPSVRSSWATARAAAAAYGEANAAYFPAVEAGASVTRERGVDEGGKNFFEETNLGPGTALSFLVFDFGGRDAEAESARQALLAANWQHNQQIQDLVLQVTIAYHVLVGSLAGVRAAEVSLEEADISLESTERRREAGVGTITDVLLAQAQRAQSSFDLVQWRGDAAIARGALATAVGLAAETVLEVAPRTREPEPTRVQVRVEDLIATALDRRPDMAAAWARLRAAESDVRKAESDLKPNVQLGTGVQRSYIYGPGFTRNGWPYVADLSVSYPVFTGYALRNAVRRAEAMSDAVRADAESQEQLVMEQVWNSYQRLLTAGQSVEAAETLLASAQLSYDSMLTSYRSGVGDIVQLMQAQTTLADARSEQVNARTGWYVALAQLARNVGTISLSGDPEPPGRPAGTQP